MQKSRSSRAAPSAEPPLPPLRRVRWQQAFRIIPTRYPPIPLFERLGDAADWEALAELESLTNDRARAELGDIAVVPVDERVVGEGASWVMAPFVHRRPSRFGDGSRGVYYAARKRRTAIAETTFHMARFYRATGEAPLDVDMRVLVGAVDERFHDLRPVAEQFRAALAADDYGPSQALAQRLRELGSRGIVYPSVRDPERGQCLAAFTPRAVGVPTPVAVLRYHFDGRRIDRVFDFERGTWDFAAGGPVSAGGSGAANGDAAGAESGLD